MTFNDTGVSKYGAAYSGRGLGIQNLSCQVIIF